MYDAIFFPDLDNSVSKQIDFKTKILFTICADYLLFSK